MNEKSPQGGGNMNKKKVLLVDTEEEICFRMKVILNREGYEAFTALNGQEAMDIFHKDKPDVCILELALPIPGISGLEVLKRIKRADITTGCIVLTNLESKINRELAKTLGADAFFAKPVDIEVLLETIKIVLHAQQKLRAIYKEKNG